jgi:hypothetical protein
VDPTREKDTAIERCDVSVEDGEGTGKSRFIVKIVCRHGMTSSLDRISSLIPYLKGFSKHTA